MDFQDFAAQETSGLVARLIAHRSESSRQHLHGVRDALDAFVRAIETAPQAEHDVQAVVARLASAADAAVRRVRDESGAGLDALRTELESLRRELDGVRDEKGGLAAALEQTEAETALLRSELQNEHERAEAADRDLAATVEAHAEVEAALHIAEAACRHESQAKLAIEERLQEASAALANAQSETSELRGQLEDLTGEHAALKEELTAARDARQRLEAAHQTVESASKHEAQARAAVEEELQEARGLLDIALAESTQLRADLEMRGSETDGLRSEVASLRDGLAQIESAQRTAEAGQQQATQAKLAAEQCLQETRGLLELAWAETAELRGRLESHVTRNAALEGDLAAAREEQTRGKAIAAELDAANARIQNLEGIQAQRDDNIRQLEAQLTDATQSHVHLRDQLADQTREESGTRAQLGNLRGEIDRMVALMDASVRAVDDLATATTVTELFVALVERLSIQFSRVALFRLKGNRLEGQEQFGFDNTIDVSKLVLPLNVDSIVTRVASSGTLERLSRHEIPVKSGMPFGGAPATALALPIVLHGETLGVVYADHVPAQTDAAQSADDTLDPDMTDEASLGFAKLLVAQTGVLLMRHTHELKMLTELRDYAVMLLLEAEHMYAADAEVGKSAADLRKRLKDNLDCASQLYAHRAALEGTAAAGLLDEQISEAIEGSTPFARDLASIVVQMSALEAQCTAEAS